MVHDLSEMREREVRTFLDRSADGRVCVAYRTDREGRIITRPDAPPWWIVGLAAALVGCAPHLDAVGLEYLDDCEAPRTCHEQVHAWRVAVEPSSRDHALDAALRPAAVTKWQDATSRVPVTPSMPPTRQPTPRPPDRPVEASGGVTLHLNFSIDPNNEHRMYVGRLEPNGRLRYTPTREIIDDLRARIRENRRDRAPHPRRR